MVDAIFLPFQFPFMIKGFIITITVAVPMALLSCFLVLRGWSLMGDAISHAVFPGVVLGYIVTPFFTASLIVLLDNFGLHSLSSIAKTSDLTMIFMTIGAFCAGMFCALATGFLQLNSRIKQDTVMGIVFSGMFGLGLLLFTNIESDVHLTHILFGNLLGVNWLDISETATISIIVAGVLIIKWRDYLLYCFDPVQTKAVGLRVRLLHYALLTMISLTIVAALKAVGIILSISLLIAPGAIAYLMTRKFSAMLNTAVAVAVICSFVGIYCSLFFGSDSAATIVLFMTVVFIFAFIVASVRARRAQSS